MSRMMAAIDRSELSPSKQLRLGVNYIPRGLVGRGHGRSPQLPEKPGWTSPKVGYAGASVTIRYCPSQKRGQPWRCVAEEAEFPEVRSES